MFMFYMYKVDIITVTLSEFYNIASLHNIYEYSCISQCLEVRYFDNFHET